MSSDHNGRSTSQRWLRRGLVLALVVLSAATSGPPASAQPGTSPTEPPPSAQPPPTAPASAANPAPRTDGDAPTNPCARGSGVGTTGASIVPDDCWGRFPSSHYDIGFDQGSWNDVSAKFYGTFTDLAFQAGRTATAMALWLVEWAYGFGVVDRLGGPAVAMARDYQHDVVGPLGLGHLVWFYAIAWAAIAGLRGRLTMAAGELVTSVVAAGVAALVLANPAGYLQGTFDTMAKLSGALLATGTAQPPPDNAIDAQLVLAPLQAQIHSVFVEEPYDYLSWGGPLPVGCATARDRILATGPHGADDQPRAAMAAAGCEQQAEYNHDANGTRLFGALLALAAAVVMVVLLALIAITVVVAQVVAVVLFALSPFALLAGVLPGAGRELAWRWLAAVARAVLAVVGMSLVLSVLLLSVAALLEASAGVGLVERFALIDMVVVAMLVARKRVLAAGHGLAGALGQRLAARRSGGDRVAPWLAAPAVAGATGFALGTSLGPDRASRTSRATSAAGRNYLANRRVTRSQHAADARSQRRASAVVSRQRTELTVDGEGKPLSRTVVSVDGPTATSRRARAARARLEQRSAGHVAAQAQRRHRGWGAPHGGAGTTPVGSDTEVDDGATTDVEEA